MERCPNMGDSSGWRVAQTWQTVHRTVCPPPNNPWRSYAAVRGLPCRVVPAPNNDPCMDVLRSKKTQSMEELPRGAGAAMPGRARPER